MTAQLNLSSIQKSYGTRVALRLDQLAILPGRLHVLTGPNGSGKSTLLSILAFLTRPERGEVMFAGRRVTWKPSELNELRKAVTLLHQSPYLFGGNVFCNVAFGLRARGTRVEEVRERVNDVLSLVGLADFEHRDVRQLSGGEARRVALARALVLKPEILLFDEPLANLDRWSAKVIESLIASLPARGTTVVMSTHEPQQVERLDGQVIRLLDGRVELSADASRDTRERGWEQVQLCPPLTMPAV